jgi:hypothetical protein
MRIIDAHIHFPHGDGLEALIETCEKNGIKQCFLCALPEEGLDNAVVKKAIEEYSDVLKGFAYLDPDRDKPEAIEKFRSEGFSGIKMIAPLKPYDWEGYFPLYEKIEEAKMPILFHTGIVARGTKPSEKGVTSSNMRPIYLETIARRFQDLTLIGAHLGHPWCEEATVVSFHNPNVYFDISGGHTFYIAQALWTRLNYDIKPSKILFGSDSTPNRMVRYVHFWQTVLPQLGLTERDLEAIFYENAAKIISRTHG